MAIYVTSKCPRCKYVFESLNPSWVDFGDPRITCPKCGLVVLFKNIKEWKLRNPFEKLWIIFSTCIWQNIVYAATILIIIWLLSVFFKSIWNKLIEPIEIQFWIITSSVIFLVITYLRSRDLIQGIRESNKRMENKEYADQMRKLY